MSQEEAEKLINKLGQEYVASENALTEHRKLIADKTSECHELLRTLYNQVKNTTNGSGSSDNKIEAKYIKADKDLSDLKKQSYDKLDEAHAKLTELQRTQVEFYISMIKLMAKELNDFRAKASKEDNVL